MLILDPKIPNLTHFGHNKNFPQKIGSVTFMCLFKSNSMQKIRKKLWVNPEVLLCRQKLCIFPILGIRIFFKNPKPSILHFCQCRSSGTISEKSNEDI